MEGKRASERDRETRQVRAQGAEGETSCGDDDETLLTECAHTIHDGYDL
jgi:hypothetical protein